MVALALQLAYGGFVVLSLSAAFAWWRRRDAARRDLAFALLTLAFPALSLLVRATEPPGQVGWEVASVLLFLLHPIALLRLASHVRPRLQRILSAALVLYLLVAAVVVASGHLTPVTNPTGSVDLVVMSLFTAATISVAAALANAGDHQIGMSRYRIWGFSAGALVTALGLAAASLSNLLGSTAGDEAFQILSLFVLFVYALAAFPPGWFRHAVDAAEAGRFATHLDEALLRHRRNQVLDRPKETAASAAAIIGEMLSADAVELWRAPSRALRPVHAAHVPDLPPGAKTKPLGPGLTNRRAEDQVDARRARAERRAQRPVASAPAGEERGSPRSPPPHDGDDDELLARWVRNVAAPDVAVMKEHRFVTTLTSFNDPVADLVVDHPLTEFFVGDHQELLRRVAFVIATRLEASFAALRQQRYLDHQKAMNERLEHERIQLRQVQREQQVVLDRTPLPLVRADIACGKAMALNEAARQLLRPAFGNVPVRKEVPIGALLALVPAEHLAAEHPIARVFRVHASEAEVGRREAARTGVSEHLPRWRPEYEHLLRARLRELARDRPAMRVRHGDETKRYEVWAHVIDDHESRWLLEFVEVAAPSSRKATRQEPSGAPKRAT